MKNYNLQLLRALAAYGVVIHHIIDSLKYYVAVGRHVPESNFGSYGVDIFFVLSGYIMMMTTSDRCVTAGKFMISRIIRLVPLYWALTLVAAGLKLAGLKLFGLQAFSFGWLAESLFFIPSFSGSSLMKPILFPGWTLNYEMMFYLYFASFLMVRSQMAKALLAGGGIVALMLAGSGSELALVKYLTNHVILGFALGIALWPITQTCRASGPAAGGLIIAGIAGLIGLDSQLLPAADFSRMLVSVSSAAIVAGAIFLEQSGKTIGAGWFAFQGDASYALYLVHPFALQIVGKVGIALAINTSLAGVVLIAAIMLLAAGIAGTALHLAVEKPLNKFLKRFVDRRREHAGPVRSAVATTG